jgi:Eukaryotic translation initiation factor 3 subunit 8 N-terminus
MASRQPGALPGSSPIPIAFLKAISAVSTALSEASSNKKKLNATNARALNGMKQKIKKAQREHESVWQAYSKVCSGLGVSRMRISFTYFVCRTLKLTSDP